MRSVVVVVVVAVVVVGLAAVHALPNVPRDGHALVQQDPASGPATGFFEATPGLLGDLANRAMSFGGAALVDVDNDGLFEVFVNGQHNANLLLKLREGVLGDVADKHGLADDTPARADKVGGGVVACDIDGDGKEEIYASVQSSSLEFEDNLWKLNRANLFVDTNSVDMNSRPTRAVACVDAAGSGLYDVYGGEQGGGVWAHNPRTHNSTDLIHPPESDASAGPVFSVLLSAPLIPHSAPLPPTGLDLFVGNAKGANQVLEFTGLDDGVLVGTPESQDVHRPLATYKHHVYPAAISDALGSARAAAVLDDNKDGLFDVVLINDEGPTGASGASQHLFVNSGAGTFEDATPSALHGIGTHARGVVVADFDNDGSDEIFVVRTGSPDTPRPNVLLQKKPRVDGSLGWVSVDIGAAAEPEMPTTGAVVGDLDNDGTLDVLLLHGGSKHSIHALTAYRPLGSSAPSLRVLPLSLSSTPARGAVVTLTHPNGDQQVRLIDAGGANAVQQEPVAHFGLGGSGGGLAYKVEVRWPCGRSVTMMNVRAGFVKVPYPRLPNDRFVDHDAASDDASANAECVEESCLTYERTCPAQASPSEPLCRDGFYFDRPPVATDPALSAAPSSCYCRRGYVLDPCPSSASETGAECAPGFEIHRALERGVHKCFCRKSDGLVDHPATTSLTISAEDLAAFKTCLSSNLLSPLRCVQLMEALGYPLELYSEWVNEAAEQARREQVVDGRYVLESCPAAGAQGSPCRDGFLLERLMIDGQERCQCAIKQTGDEYQITPCPKPDAPPPSCQPGYHFQRSSPAENSTCHCVRDEYHVDPCPPLGTVNDADLCDEGFKLTRVLDGSRKEQCKCVRTGWEVSPCPVGSDEVCSSVCPPPFVFERVRDAAGERCACVDPATAHSQETAKECEFCHYGYGRCAYDYTKGWYCECHDPTYEGPDCIHIHA